MVAHGQPLHVGVVINAASTERRNVVDLVSRAGQAGATGGWAGIGFDESVALDGAALGLGESGRWRYRKNRKHSQRTTGC